MNHGQRHGRLTKHLLFDAGTSTFSSSLRWFSCAYSQRKMSFDQIYGWELQLLEPIRFWRQVPEKWKAFYHFFNTPVEAGLESEHSPLRIIQQLATVDDFVSFKLDIDCPSVEIPVVQQILKHHHLANLIDEFFFELHFNCEIMMFCGWGTHPEVLFDQKLDRYSALQLFRDLRMSGVRAHFWP